jgi:hypothetical protein
MRRASSVVIKIKIRTLLLFSSSFLLPRKYIYFVVVKKCLRFSNSDYNFFVRINKFKKKEEERNGNNTTTKWKNMLCGFIEV